MTLVELLIEKWDTISVAVGGIVAWFYERKKRDEELILLKNQSVSSEIANLSEIIGKQREMINNQANDIKELRQEIKDLKEYYKDIIDKYEQKIEEFEHELESYRPRKKSKPLSSQSDSTSGGS